MHVNHTSFLYADGFKAIPFDKHDETLAAADVYLPDSSTEIGYVELTFPTRSPLSPPLPPAPPPSSPNINVELNGEFKERWDLSIQQAADELDYYDDQKLHDYAFSRKCFTFSTNSSDDESVQCERRMTQNTFGVDWWHTNFTLPDDPGGVQPIQDTVRYMSTGALNQSKGVLFSFCKVFEGNDCSTNATRCCLGDKEFYLDVNHPSFKYAGGVVVDHPTKDDLDPTQQYITNVTSDIGYVDLVFPTAPPALPPSPPSPLSPPSPPSLPYPPYPPTVCEDWCESHMAEDAVKCTFSACFECQFCSS